MAVSRGFARRPDIPAERMIPGSTLTASEIFLNNARIVLVILATAAMIETTVTPELVRWMAAR